MPHASSQAVAAKFHVGQRFTGIQFLVTMPQCRQVSQYIVNRREAERRPLFLCVSCGAFPVEEIQKWNNATVLTVVAMFFAGMILGGLLVPHESELMRIASNDARIAISLPNGAAPTAWR